MEGAATRPFSTLPPATAGASFGRGDSVRVRALPSLNSLITRYEEGELERPRFTGDETLSRFVSSLIAVKPLFSVMKVAARQVLIRFVSLFSSTFPPCCCKC
jgi:hypothetical protein